MDRMVVHGVVNDDEISLKKGEYVYVTNNETETSWIIFDEVICSGRSNEDGFN